MTLTDLEMVVEGESLEQWRGGLGASLVNFDPDEMLLGNTRRGLLLLLLLLLMLLFLLTTAYTYRLVHV